MDCVKRPTVFSALCLTGICFIMTGCPSVDTIRFTNQTFPPKKSALDVEVMALEPKCPHIAIAQLSVEDSAVSYEDEEGAILKKAADLGADAVVLHKGTKRTVATPAYGGYAYNYGYPGWGYASYGMVGYGGYGTTGYTIGGFGYAPYGMGTPMMYDTTLRSLTAIAIRYKNGRRCETGGPESRQTPTTLPLQS
ncbi:MAG: hypothetical protein NPIRA03_19530 [Nitrospirales bacterium]|nr:MAG: hypothetical protein NPIRA03_19530 [Nitrospirales bacterium]